MDQRRDAARVGGMHDTPNMRSNVVTMTDPAPEQLRALADQAGYYVEWAESNASDEECADLTQFRDALGAAADQLEAVQAQRDKWAARVAAVERVADEAQDDEDGNGWVPIDPLLDALYPKKRGVSND